MSQTQKENSNKKEEGRDKWKKEKKREGNRTYTYDCKYISRGSMTLVITTTEIYIWHVQVGLTKICQGTWTDVSPLQFIKDL